MTRKESAPSDAPSDAPSETLEHVHETTEQLASIELTPPHGPRAETPAYRAAHEHLLYVRNEGCWCCGVRHSDLMDESRRADRRINPYGATQMESHHFPIERSLIDGIDRDRLAQDYPSVLLFETLEEWVDTEHNLVACCDQCHRGIGVSFHHALFQDLMAKKFAKRDPESGAPYVFAATKADAGAALAEDEAILRADGTEARVVAEIHSDAEDEGKEPAA